MSKSRTESRPHPIADGSIRRQADSQFGSFARPTSPNFHRSITRLAALARPRPSISLWPDIIFSANRPLDDARIDDEQRAKAKTTKERGRANGKKPQKYFKLFGILFLKLPEDIN